MATPSEKSLTMTNFLEDLAGRTTAIEGNFCVRAPMGCGGSAEKFDDALSRKEYSISGLCQKCQDAVFGKG